MTTFKVGDRVQGVDTAHGGGLGTVCRIFDCYTALVCWDGGGVYDHETKYLQLVENNQPAKKPTMTKTTQTTWKFAADDGEYTIMHDSGDKTLTVYLRDIETSQLQDTMDLPVAELSAILREIEGGK